MNIYKYVVGAPEKRGLILDQTQVEELRKWLINDAARIGQLRATVDTLRDDCAKKISADLVVKNMNLEKELEEELAGANKWNAAEAGAYWRLKKNYTILSNKLARYEKGFIELSASMDTALSLVFGTEPDSGMAVNDE